MFVYPLANAVAAGIVHKTAHGKGFNSPRMEYGQPRVVTKPHIGIWSKRQQHKHRRSSRRSGRAAFASRSKMPETAVLILDRPRISPELSDAELRTRIRRELAHREAKIRAKRAGWPVLGVLGMKTAQKILQKASRVSPVRVAAMLVIDRLRPCTTAGDACSFLDCRCYVRRWTGPRAHTAGTGAAAS